jgi:hypothetical protein
MVARRYRVRLFHQGYEPLRKQIILAALDLESPHGLAAARIELDRLLYSLAYAARIRGKQVADCHLEVIDEASGQVACHHYATYDQA